MSGAIPLLPLHTLMAWTGTCFFLSFELGRYSDWTADWSIEKSSFDSQQEGEVFMFCEACRPVLWPIRCLVSGTQRRAVDRSPYNAELLERVCTTYMAWNLLNHLTPNGHYMGRTAQLTSRCCILCIYSTNVRTEYFKHAA